MEFADRITVVFPDELREKIRLRAIQIVRKQEK